MDFDIHPRAMPCTRPRGKAGWFATIVRDHARHFSKMQEHSAAAIVGTMVVFSCVGAGTDLTTLAGPGHCVDQNERSVSCLSVESEQPASAGRVSPNRQMTQMPG
jgi:hypothetical protein